MVDSPQRRAFQQGTAGENLDMPRLVRGLDGEKLHHLPKMRMQPAQHPCRHQQGRRFVFDQIGYHLDDGVLDLVVMVDGCCPIDGGFRVPLGSRRAGVEPGGVIGPEFDFLDQAKIENRSAQLDLRTSPGKSPMRRRPVGHALCRRAAAAFRRKIDMVQGRRDGAPHVAAQPGCRRKTMSVGAAPDAQMQAEFRVASRNFDPFSRFGAAQGPAEQKIAAGFQSEAFQINAQRGIRRENGNDPRRG